MLKIIFQNEDFIIIDKSAGLAVHSGIGISEKTLVDFLVEKFPEIKSVGDALPRISPTVHRGGARDPEFRPGIVHRLDKETSGVMVVARSQKIFEYLKNLFKNREVEKKYLALVHGKLKNKSGKIEGEMGRSRRDFRKQTLVRGKISVRKERYSLTYYKVIKEYKDHSLLEIFPKTGRTHQIRVHLHSIGHPVVGDGKYAFKKYKRRKYARMFLHASEISFVDQKGKKMRFISPSPKEMAKGLSGVDGRGE